jgi:hypothetical protein
VLFLLGLYLLFVELPAGDRSDDGAPTSERLFSFLEAAVTGITIQKSDGSRIVLSHTPEHPDTPWRIMEPVEAVADSARAGALLSHLVSLVGSRKVEEQPTDVAPYGLSPPAYTILIAINQVDTEVLDIGAFNLDRTERYAREGVGSPVWLIPSAINPFLDGDVKSWTAAERS